jgi:hypothetical protein
LSGLKSDNCYWWDNRSERSSIRQKIFDAKTQVLNRSYTTPYRLKLDISNTIKGGTNFDNNKNIDYANIAVAPHGPLDTDDIINVPANYLFAGVVNTSSLLVDCDDELPPNKKVKYQFTTFHGRDYSSSSLGYGEVLNSKIALPANFVSGTINTGYQSQVVNQFMSGVIITNIHNDTYGNLNETPIQGPFTNAWVGGRQSRHVNLNTGSDNYTTRPEAWKIVLGSLFTSSYQTAIGFVGADYPYPEGNPDEPSYPVRIHKRATLLREETAKRSVNIRNIQTSTGSAVLGNYTNTYEVLHTFGATSNNRMLVDAANPTITNEFYGILRTDADGRVNFELPTIPKSQTVIRNRFSAPGDYRTNSRGYLSRYSEETSPYNVLPFRNREIIGTGRNNRDARGATSDSRYVPNIVSGSLRDYNSLVSYYTEFGGTVSGSSGQLPSIHKVSQNRSITVSYSGSSIVTKFDYDNGFISRAIPQSDEGYSWIVDSLEPSSTRTAIIASNSRLGPARLSSKFTFPSASTSEYVTVNYVSSSQIGSYFDLIGPNGVMFPEDINNSTGKNQFIPIDFAGLNTLVYETSSLNTLGQTVSSYAIFINTTFIDTVSPKTQNTFCALMHHRGGSYGYPVFKQIRTGQHRVARNLRESNYISIDKGFILRDVVYRGQQRRFFNVREIQFGSELGVETFKEPVVEVNSLPMKVVVKDIINIIQPDHITLKLSYENLIKNFSNNDLNSVLNLPKFNQQVTTYDALNSLNLIDNSRYVIDNVEYEVVIFPNPNNTTLSRTRQRDLFESKWNSSRYTRNKNNISNIF